MIPDKEHSTNPDENGGQQATKQVSLLFKIILLVIFIAIWVFLTRLEYQNPTKPGLVYITATRWFLLYISGVIFLSFFSQFRFIRIIQIIVSAPAAIIMALGPIIHSIGAIFIVFIGVFVISTAIFTLVPDKIFHWHVMAPAGLFISLTVTSITVTSFGNRLVEFYHDLDGRDEKEKYKLLSLKVLDQAKTRLLIFTLYFILLIVFTFLSLNQIELLAFENIHISILQSFAAYTAFDRIVANWHTIKKPKSN